MTNLWFVTGFMEIDQEDQIKLIKQGSFEVLLTRFSMLVDPDNQDMLDPTHTVRTPRLAHLRVLESLVYTIFILLGCFEYDKVLFKQILSV